MKRTTTFRAVVAASILTMSATSSTGLPVRKPSLPVLAKRQATGQFRPVPLGAIPDECQESCSTFANTWNDCTDQGLSCYCTDDMGSQLSVCFECLASVDDTPVATATAQTALNAWAGTCRTGGHEVATPSFNTAIAEPTGDGEGEDEDEEAAKSEGPSKTGSKDSKPTDDIDSDSNDGTRLRPGASFVVFVCTLVLLSWF